MENLTETQINGDVRTDADTEIRVEDMIERMLRGSHVRRSLTTEGKTKSFDFWQIYGMIIALILVVIGGSLGSLWQNLRLYERSQPGRVLDQYMRPLIQGGLPRIMVYEASKPAKYETPQERDAYIRAFLVMGEMTCVRSASGSSDGEEVFLFKAGGVTLAVVTLEKVNTGRYGWWEPKRDEVNMPIYGNLRVITPEDVAVLINGIGLFSEDRVDEDMYLLTGLYRKPDIAATDLSGNFPEILWQEDEDGPLARIIPVTSLTNVPANGETSHNEDVAMDDEDIALNDEDIALTDDEGDN